MRSSSLSRLISAFVAVAASLVMLGEAAGVHNCPVHDLVPAAASPAHESSTSHDAAHTAPDAHHGAAPEQPADSHGCHCLGPCSASRADALAAAPNAEYSPACVDVKLGVTIAAVSHDVVPPPYTLPFAHAPPAIALS